MDAISSVQSHLRRYFSAVERVMKNLKPGDGLFGLGNDPKRDPCHMAFYDALSEILSQAQSQPLSEAELDELVACVLRLDADNAGQLDMVRLMLQAVQGLTLPLIPRISQPCAEELAAWYAQYYPRKSRMPNQSKVLRALDRRAGKGLFRRR
jgi:hypothetical protein